MQKAFCTPPKLRGFALVVTLTLMILLTLIAVGLLSLSAVSLRTSSQAKAESDARANARLALMLAIGELQKHTGADTRITAPADRISPSLPPLVGVWRSWEGNDHQTTGNLAGRPIRPDYSTKEKSSAEGGRFLIWLISGAKTGFGPADSLSELMTPGSDNKQIVGTFPFKNTEGSKEINSIPILSEGTLGAIDTRQIHLYPQVVKGTGGFAWWVSGENQKANLPKPYEPKSDTAAGWSDLARSHAVADPEVFGLESLLSDPSPARKSFTRNTGDLFAKEGAAVRPSQSFHDLSATSVGLLTNVATGGWRKDFSLLTENWDAQPTSGLEFFKVSPTQHLQYTRPANDLDPRRGIL